MQNPSSLMDLATSERSALSDVFRSTFEVECATAARLHMNDEGWASTGPVLGPQREAIEAQRVIFTRDRARGHEAAINPLRAGRAPTPQPVPLGRAEETGICPWCDRAGWHASRRGLWADDFGDVLSADGRVAARPNWARQAPVSGLVFGDERMHHLMNMRREDFVALFEVALCYINRARRAHPAIDHYMIFINGGLKSASSVSHAHLQVVGRSGRHFAYPEAVVTHSPVDYWERVRLAHDEVGLAVARGAAMAWASLVPAKERDTTAVSSTVTGGAGFIYDVLQVLVHHGTTSFSLAGVSRPLASRSANG
jgi:diadenosine tetraphosphate (Ap4A) HIT family hydrolase